MLFLYINNSDRTADLIRGSIERTNQIQQRADSLSFSIFQNSKPTENHDVRFFVGDTIASSSGATITLNGYFERNTNKYFAGQVLYIRIGDADEEKCTVLSYNETTLQLVLTAAPSGTVSAGDKIAELKFGGVVSRVKDSNVEVLSNLEYEVECVDYTKVFDKKIVSDTWADADSRYIINDFVNTTVNYNQVLDQLAYADNTAIQAEWIESGTGGNPTVDTSDFLESTASGIFSWTGSGTATFTASPVSLNVSDFTGASSGTPTKGSVMIWLKFSDYTDVTSIKLRVGSDSSNYVEMTMDAPTDNDWYYTTKKLTSGTVTGTPVWTALDYIAIVVAETGSSNVRANGFRINANNSFTLYNVTSTSELADFRSPQLKPTSLMQTLAKNFSYIWYIDYERDIHFLSSSITTAPFGFSDTSNNFYDMSIEVDQSQLGNRVIVRGGERQSDSYYAQVIQGTNGQREWVLKNKFADLSILIDDNGTTHSAEAGTNTTNIKWTAHGFSVGDHVINRTRSNAVREIAAIVDADNFTVETVTSQTSTDTISKFATSKTVGIEGIVDEATVDYVYNSNAQSVRASSATTTLSTTVFIRFKYLERIPIQIQYTDSASANALKALGFGDGIFDLDPITDRNISDITTAIVLAQAAVKDFRNPLITGKVKTDQDGLKAGQTITVSDTNRSFSGDYIVQQITSKVKAGTYDDYFIHKVVFGTTLFGIIEFYQKLLRQGEAIEINTEEAVSTYVTAEEGVEFSGVEIAQKGGFESATVAETVTTDETNTVVDFTPPWKWEANGAGQPLNTRWNLFSWG